jgi:hypothetical protein
LNSHPPAPPYPSPSYPISSQNQQAPGFQNPNRRVIWGSRSAEIFDKIEQIGEGTYGSFDLFINNILLNPLIVRSIWQKVGKQAKF